MVDPGTGHRDHLPHRPCAFARGDEAVVAARDRAEAGPLCPGFWWAAPWADEAVAGAAASAVVLEATRAAVDLVASEDLAAA